jgi:hypothetical protein
MAAAAPPANVIDAQPPQQQAILQQGPLTLPGTLSQMRADEVRRDIIGFCEDEPAPPRRHRRMHRQSCSRRRRGNPR